MTTYRHMSRELAKKAAKSVKRERQALADTVCPDSDCKQPQCIAARAAAMMGADWRSVFAAAYGASK